jgi:hypothetical protein
VGRSLGRFSLFGFGRCSSRSTGFVIVKVMLISFFVIGDRHNQEAGVGPAPPDTIA